MPISRLRESEYNTVEVPITSPAATETKARSPDRHLRTPAVLAKLKTKKTPKSGINVVSPPRVHHSSKERTMYGEPTDTSWSQPMSHEQQQYEEKINKTMVEDGRSNFNEIISLTETQAEVIL
jgi:hypothetical protein